MWGQILAAMFKGTLVKFFVGFGLIVFTALSRLQRWFGVNGNNVPSSINNFYAEGPRNWQELSNHVRNVALAQNLLPVFRNCAASLNLIVDQSLAQHGVTNAILVSLVHSSVWSLLTSFIASPWLFVQYLRRNGNRRHGVLETLFDFLWSQASGRNGRNPVYLVLRIIRRLLRF